MGNWKRNCDGLLGVSDVVNKTHCAELCCKSANCTAWMWHSTGIGEGRNKTKCWLGKPSRCNTTMFGGSKWESVGWKVCQVNQEVSSCGCGRKFGDARCASGSFCSDKKPGKCLRVSATCPKQSRPITTYPCKCGNSVCERLKDGKT